MVDILIIIGVVAGNLFLGYYAEAVACRQAFAERLTWDEGNKVYGRVLLLVGPLLLFLVLVGFAAWRYALRPVWWWPKVSAKYDWRGDYITNL